MSEEAETFAEAERALLDARGMLLAMRTPEGVWEGGLSSSALATATAVSALAMARLGTAASGIAGKRGGISGVGAGGGGRGGCPEAGNRNGGPSGSGGGPGPMETGCGGRGYGPESDTDAELIARGVRWLADHRNADGGYGDTPDSPSNLPTTMLVLGAFALAKGSGNAGVDGKACREAAEAAEAYVSREGGKTEEERAKALYEIYAPDRTFAVPIMCNLALAGLMRWELVPDLPFELAALPSGFFRFARLHVVSYAMPALIAVGRLVAVRKGSCGPFRRAVGDAAFRIAMRKLEDMQPESGGFLEAVPLTAFVTMSLIGIGLGSVAVARKGLDFLRKSVRADGSWPVDSNLSVWITTAAVEAMSPGGEYEGPDGERILRWLLDRQTTRRHSYTGAMAGGWGWTHLSGGVPDADDTAGALLALAAFWYAWRRGRLSGTTPAANVPAGDQASRSACGAAPEPAPATRPGAWADAAGGSDSREGGNWDRDRHGREIAAAAYSGIRWLLALHNSDGGWPTFCRGWGKLPFDRSAPDLTAHVLRALAAWKALVMSAPELGWLADVSLLNATISIGCAYLHAAQRADGSWIPLWFGNQHTPDMSNPVIGTARVLTAFSWIGEIATRRIGADAALKAVRYLLSCQNPDGGWGGSRGAPSTMEETALALSALSAWAGVEPIRRGCLAGARFLARGVREGAILRPAPIGLYFARLWYSERAYPIVWTVGALGRLLRASAG
ncbi:MAG: squalene--hopene cyclase [Planctomycetota bacterium]|nr:squalene--hopene cyclase [Planctomycetota bacterium]